MCLKVELFVLSVESNQQLRYVRREAEVVHGDNPDDVAWSMIEARHGSPGPGAEVLHSTSWRWEEGGTVVLTYVACSGGIAMPHEPARRLARDAVALTDSNPVRPRPERITEREVVAHAVRHLGLLVRASTSGRIAAALAPEALEFFRSVEPGVAGRIDPDAN